MVGEGLMLGFSSGAYCLVSCLPVFLPFLSAEPMERWRRNAGYLSLILLGRLLGYVVAGSIISWAGGFLLGYVDPTLKKKLLAAANIGAGLMMILSSLVFLRPRGGLCRRLKRIWSPSRKSLAVGFFTGLNFCPPFFAAAARVFGRGDPFQGGIYFFFFFLGTSLYLLPLLAVQPLQKHVPEIRFVGQTSMLLLGIYFSLVQGVFLTSQGFFK